MKLVKPEETPGPNRHVEIAARMETVKNESQEGVRQRQQRDKPQQDDNDSNCASDSHSIPVNAAVSVLVARL